MKLWEIAEEMGITAHSVVSFVGAGGKTSCILKLAEYWAKQGEKVLVTTSTHMEHPDVLGKDGMVDKKAEGILEEIQEKGWTIAGEQSKHPKKITGISPEQLEDLSNKVDKVLIEADGSKRYPLKVPGKASLLLMRKQHTFLLWQEHQLLENHWKRYVFAWKRRKNYCFRQMKHQKV